MRYAIITNNIASNIIVADQAFADSIGAIEAPDHIGPGWGYDGSWIEPAPAPVEVPTSVTMRQARLALLAAGLLPTVTAAITTAGEAAQIEWEYAQEVQRSSGLVPAMATALGMTDAQIDALFVSAAAL